MDFKLDKEKIDALPYSAVQELVTAKKLFAGLIERAIEERMQITEGSDYSIFAAVDKDNDYHFILNSVSYNSQENRVIYSVAKKPQTREILAPVSHNLVFSKIEEVFQGWLTEVNALRAVKNQFYFPERLFDEDQFREFFTNDDDDAAYNPFELHRQQVIYKFLTYAENVISQDAIIAADVKQDLLNDVAILKEDIPKLSKKRFVAALSKFAQRTKTVRNSLFNTIFDVIKKEAIKNIIFDKGSHIETVIHAIQEWSRHLPNVLP